ncbi:hypothetical protein IQ230_09670 [Gloeocapsopsis crepidinum LEGE 06123]|uniref:Uncharacterized protein n=1 Tax=Gloeocapsopsis crepidinum LEGE 06123 TaxID=588587 RepID=A0ABR9UQR5_9CHRO|nr:hypothetical protein [Gloeocapsopsis crepidinum]MBE9190624.1 hypothetical protein [Gloeocapsopsis crepidinum LEGE 06123]
MKVKTELVGEAWKVKAKYAGVDDGSGEFEPNEIKKPKQLPPSSSAVVQDLDYGSPEWIKRTHDMAMLFEGMAHTYKMDMGQFLRSKKEKRGWMKFVETLPFTRQTADNYIEYYEKAKGLPHLDVRYKEENQERRVVQPFCTTPEPSENKDSSSEKSGETVREADAITELVVVRDYEQVVSTKTDTKKENKYKRQKEDQVRGRVEISTTPEIKEIIRTRRIQLGYKTDCDYLLHLVMQDAIKAGFTLPEENEQ